MKLMYVTIVMGVFLSTSLFASELIPQLRAVQDKSELKPHVGFLLGAGNPEGSLQTGANYAFEIGYQPYVPFSFSGKLTVEDYSNSSNNKLVRSSLLAKVSYNLGGKIPLIRYSYISLGMEPMFEDTENKNQMAIGVMPNLGFDYPLSNIMDSPLSLGMNLSYLYTTSSNPDVFAANAVVKYWY